MTRARYVGSVPKLWDRIILFLFTCSSIVFFYALLGFGKADDDMRALNSTFVHPRDPLSEGFVTPNGDQKAHRHVSRVVVGWDGNYELLLGSPSATVSRASIPQDAFPDPTPAVVRAEGGRAMQRSPTTHADTPVDVPFTYATPYDPLRLAFDGGVQGGEYHGLYPVAGPPRTPLPSLRIRRFGRCFGGEACLY